GGGTPVGAGAGGGFGSTVGAAAQAELTWGAPAPVTATDKGDTAGGTVGAAQRRGGAHRAPHRSRLHARPQQTPAHRRALVVMLAVALTIVASDAGAGARPTRRPSRLLVLPATGNGTSGPFAVVSPPSGTDGGGTHNGAGTPSLGPLAQGANAASGKPGEAPTTTPSMPCVKSFAASCGPMVWSPPVNNKPLTVTFSYFPQHPMPGQQVTFNVVLEDPDDTNLGINGEYFGDAAGAAAAAAGTASTPGPSCPTFHGSWPPPGPGAKGHNELQVRHTYGSPGAYDVYFTASSGRVGGPCDLPDPYASAGMSAVVRVVVDPLPPPPTTTILTTTTTTPRPPTDTTTTAPSGNP
ncbi:MAG: hypothetical protein M3083_06760, partial [Actinomycetota bacterium]|nr:hypothetical protein [Actinomycetota bacterium]